jgi:hypothetical protein
MKRSTWYARGLHKAGPALAAGECIFHVRDRADRCGPATGGPWGGRRPGAKLPEKRGSHPHSQPARQPAGERTKPTSPPANRPRPEAPAEALETADSDPPVRWELYRRGCFLYPMPARAVPSPVPDPT